MSDRPRVAAVLTEYRPHSHADVIVTKLLTGYSLNGVPRGSRVDVAALYVDQFPENDMARSIGAQYDIPIYSSIEGALTLGGSNLAVDGVLLIGEHGRYPYNDLGQHLYPRYRFFTEAAAVIRSSGRPIPLFNDKHLSYSWDEAAQMYAAATSLHLPFMAGSVLPLTWRRPPFELATGSRVNEALAVGYGDIEAYGFHALEALQCMVERRSGGEVGVASVQCLTGDDVWAGARAGFWSGELEKAVLAALPDKAPGEPRRLVKEPAAFLIE